MNTSAIDLVDGRRRDDGPKLKASRVVALDIVRTMYEAGLGPGDRYLSEADALERHNVGRGTYREALRFLEMQGVIVMRPGPGGGPEIRQPGWPHLASAIALLLQFAGAPLRSLLETRIAVEPGMAEMAAANATDDEIAALATDLDVVEENLGDYRQFNAAYLGDWRDLSRRTHNPLLAFLSPAMRAIVNSAGFVPNEPYRVEVLGRLRRIHAAIADRDPAGARSTMRELELEFYDRLTKGY